jgi:hypothetical protein
MFRLLAIPIILAATCVSSVAHGASEQPNKPLRYSCPTAPFVSVSASTPERDALPAVQITLTDALGQTAGRQARGKRIPTSRYGEVTEIPSMPNKSMVLAVEVCDAPQGEYRISVDERAALLTFFQLEGTLTLERKPVSICCCTISPKMALPGTTLSDFGLKRGTSF